jgi:hypothetical protein
LKEDDYGAVFSQDLFTRALIAAELVISVAGMYHMLNGWTGPESPFNLSDIRLFNPA